MDIDLLAKLVRDVILEKDEVTLPGVGSFVAETVPATFSDKGFTLNPPYRKLSFRQRQGSDTYLVDLYAKTCQIDQAEAKTTIEDFLSEMKEVLKIRKTIIFPSLGRLRATKENYFFFVCDENLDIFPQGFGLEPVSLKTHTSSSTSSYIKPQPQPQPQSQPQPQPQPQSQPKPQPQPQSEPEQEPVPAPAPAPAPVQIVEDTNIVTETPVKNKRTGLKIIIALIILFLIFFAAVAVLGRVAPDFIDQFLYSAEELQILNY